MLKYSKWRFRSLNCDLKLFLFCAWHSEKLTKQFWCIIVSMYIKFLFVKPGNTRGGSITVPLTSCLTCLESAAWQLTIFVFICKTDKSKRVKQEVNSTVIFSPFSIPWSEFLFWLASGSSPVVEHLSHHPKDEGSTTFHRRWDLKWNRKSIKKWFFKV